MEKKVLNMMEDNEVLPEDVQKKLDSILERYQHMSDEEKEEFQKGAFDILTRSLNKLPGDTFLPTWLMTYQSLILFTFAILVVIFPLVIITRKLYRRMKERDERKEAKRKLKGQKKKKNT